MTPDQNDLVRSRQQGRARVMGVLLAGFAVLTFLIAIVKIKGGIG